MITQTIDLCMIPGSTNPVIHVNQYDAYPGGLIFNLYEESAFEIPAGAAVTINGTKPDRYGFSYTASYSGNVVTADLTKQMTAVAGNVECELRVTQGDQIIGTQNFTLAVEEAALNDETVISDSDIPAIANAERYASEAAASAAEAASTLASALKKTDLVNDATQTVAGEKALDAAYGKTLADGKVSKSGDTMTGNLALTGGANTYVRGTDASINTPPSGNYWGHGLVLQDAAGADFGQVKSFHMTDGTRGVYIESKAGVGNTMRLGANGTTPYVYVDYPQAWFNAINYPQSVNSGSIDDIVAPGFYYLPLNSVSDLPEGGNGILWVLAESQSNRVRQIFMRTGTAGTNDGIVYIRQSQNNLTGWGQWYKHGDATMYVSKSGGTMTGDLTVPSLYLENGAQIYEYSSGALHLMTSDAGTEEAVFGITPAARLAIRNRTRGSASDTWGSWSSWQYLDDWNDVVPSAGTNVSNISYSMARYNPLLKLCCLDINIRINATSLASSENLLTGLPKPTAMMQTIIGASNNDIVNVKITTTGYLQVDGAKTLTASGKYFNGYITYPYSSLS